MSEQIDPRTADLKAWLLMHGVYDLAFLTQDRPPFSSRHTPASTPPSLNAVR